MAASTSDYRNYYDDKSGAACSEFHGRLSPEHFESGVNTVIDILRDQKTHKVMVDLYDLGVMKVEYQKYIQENWFPRAMEAGMTHIGFVIPKDPFGRYGMSNANKDAEQEMPVEMKYFESKAECQEWLGNL